jgi:hypothetical protein
MRSSINLRFLGKGFFSGAAFPVNKLNSSGLDFKLLSATSWGGSLLFFQIPPSNSSAWAATPSRLRQGLLLPWERGCSVPSAAGGDDRTRAFLLQICLEMLDFCSGFSPVAEICGWG